MKRFCAFLTAASILVVCFGFYRGWFSVASNQAATSNKVGVTLSVDPDQVKRDADTVKTKVRLAD